MLFQLEHYFQLHKFRSDAKVDVIVEYALILNERQMQQYLKACTSVTEMLTREEQWIAMWKKINLLRVCCEFHYENIQTFRIHIFWKTHLSLHGYTYLGKVIWETYLDLSSFNTEPR